MSRLTLPLALVWPSQMGRDDTFTGQGLPPGGGPATSNPTTGDTTVNLEQTPQDWRNGILSTPAQPSGPTILSTPITPPVAPDVLADPIDPGAGQPTVFGTPPAPPQPLILPGATIGGETLPTILTMAPAAPGAVGQAYDISTKNLTTPAERAAAVEYAKRVNTWLAANGPATVQSTAGPLRSQADAAARNERTAAAAAGQPYQGQAGHVPDTALTGQPNPPAGWLDMPGRSNSVVGGGLSSRIGQVISVITVDGKVPP